MIEQVKQWLEGLPGLEGIEHKILEQYAGEIALNCRGQEILWEKENILGGKTRRLRLSFGLGTHSTDMHDLEIPLLLNRKAVLNGAPVFGKNQTVKIEHGQAVMADNEGIIRMEAMLTFEYTEEEE